MNDKRVEAERVIALTKTEDWWIARDETTELTVQGASRSKALENLDAVIDGAEGNGGHEPTDKMLSSESLICDERTASIPHTVPRI